MGRALVLAKRGLWSTDPNPRVGCVIVNSGAIVGEGWHEQPGGPHAEVNALSEAGSSARGATAFVTLEPCCHHGKTGPCTTALIKAGVARVVAAMVDPNPLVAGRGLETLRQAGIETRSGLLESSARDLNLGFCLRMTHARPYVRAKLAMSLDARTAMANGESQWITGPAARADVQKLRARSSVIMTGVGTVLADNPSLNVRKESLGLPAQAAIRQPLRVVVDSRARTPPTAKMLTLPGRTIVATCSSEAPAREALLAAGALVWELECMESRVGLADLLRRLAAEQANEVLLECGPTLAGAMLSKGCIDELVLYVAPRILGSDARGLFSLPSLARLSDAVELEVSDTRCVGNDIRVTARIKHEA